MKSSANESNVGENINHQYQKSYEYEEDFLKYYSTKYLKIPTFYFSFLRPLNELQDK